MGENSSLAMDVTRSLPEMVADMSRVLF